MQSWFNIQKLTNITYVNTWLYQLIQKKAFGKIQHPFMIKPLNKVGTKGMHSDVIKDIYDKPTANIVLNGEKLKTTPFKSGTRQSCSFT